MIHLYVLIDIIYARTCSFLLSSYTFYYCYYVYTNVYEFSLLFCVVLLSVVFVNANDITKSLLFGRKKLLSVYLSRPLHTVSFSYLIHWIWAINGFFHIVYRSHARTHRMKFASLILCRLYLWPLLLSKIYHNLIYICLRFVASELAHIVIIALKSLHGYETRSKANMKITFSEFNVSICSRIGRRIVLFSWNMSQNEMTQWSFFSS